MSPEQVCGGAVDANDEIYAIGCLIYECVVLHARCFVRESFHDPNLRGSLPVRVGAKGLHGDAVLMEMQHFRNVHYPDAFQPVSELDSLAQEVYDLIRLEPAFTGPLRKRAIAKLACTKSQFNTALKKLQVSSNIVRSNDPKMKND